MNVETLLWWIIDETGPPNYFKQFIMSSRSTRDIRVVSRWRSIYCILYDTCSSRMFKCQQFRLAWEISCQAENEFCHETSLVKVVKIKHYLILWKLTTEKISSNLTTLVLRIAYSIKHAQRPKFSHFFLFSFDRSCFFCLYSENNYISNSLGKYKRTIFIDRSENVNVEMCEYEKIKKMFF